MKVLVAMDHTRTSLEAARTAVRLLGPSGAEFLVVNVAEVPVPWLASTPGFGVVAPLTLEVEPASEVDEAAVLADEAEAAGVPDAEIEVVIGDPGQEICAAAERHDVDLIVVGSHDRSALARLIEPSVSHRVLRGSSCPVLVVPDRHPTD
ncbi:universal stress protein [Iamia sp. SCSIO 61187]|uniref:universal stress protein n=1 Tax=Iamia sp. SCSIO 61187 TaxID=2722752 RepID=UPI001C6382B6|nr:universal stress protein [Iamia sp. SCSIO 61187]QYG93193.1 universal stress protein [Iamia sp. SCSIO 61187]